MLQQAEGRACCDSSLTMVRTCVGGGRWERSGWEEVGEEWVGEVGEEWVGEVGEEWVGEVGEEWVGEVGEEWVGWGGEGNRTIRLLVGITIDKMAT